MTCKIKKSEDFTNTLNVKKDQPKVIKVYLNILVKSYNPDNL